MTGGSASAVLVLDESSVKPFGRVVKVRRMAGIRGPQEIPPSCNDETNRRFVRISEEESALRSWTA
jgi:hypothetical protein